MEYTLASNCTKEELQEIIKGALLNIKDYQEALEIACQLSFEALEDHIQCESDDGEEPSRECIAFQVCKEVLN